MKKAKVHSLIHFDKYIHPFKLTPLSRQRNFPLPQKASKVLHDHFPVNSLIAMSID